LRGSKCGSHMQEAVVHKQGILIGNKIVTEAIMSLCVCVCSLYCTCLVLLVHCSVFCIFVVKPMCINKIEYDKHIVFINANSVH